ncbi:hypothetical protein B0O80DRAFT_471363 [Mortierella sp. GBAus27b]|nr:hypothetical protein B0O80DRAFT_471363 [Mortierella sp. GBAus27b]
MMLLVMGRRRKVARVAIQVPIHERIQFMLLSLTGRCLIHVHLMRVCLLEISRGSMVTACAVMSMDMLCVEWLLVRRRQDLLLKAVVGRRRLVVRNQATGVVRWMGMAGGIRGIGTIGVTALEMEWVERVMIVIHAVEIESRSTSTGTQHIGVVRCTRGSQGTETSVRNRGGAAEKDVVPTVGGGRPTRRHTLDGRADAVLEQTGAREGWAKMGGAGCGGSTGEGRSQERGVVGAESGWEGGWLVSW